MTKFTTKDGCRYEIVTSSTWKTISGKTITTHRINMDNPASGHGWGGIIGDAEMQEILATRIEECRA